MESWKIKMLKKKKSLLKLSLLRDTLAEPQTKNQFLLQSIPLPYPALFYFLALIST